MIITNVRVIDLRFPTSREHIGSDAVNKDPDYSAAYCILETDAGSKATASPSPSAAAPSFVVSALQYLARMSSAARSIRITADFERLLPRAHRRHPVPLARPRKRRHPPRLRRAPQRRLGPLRQAKASPSGSCSPTCPPSRSSLPSTSATSPTPSPPTKPSRSFAAASTISPSASPPRSTRLPRLHHLGRMVRLQRRQDSPPLPRGPRRRLDPLQAQGRRRRRPTTSAAAASSAKRSAGPTAHGRRQPELGRRRSHRPHRELAELDPWWMEEPTSPDDILGHARIRREVAPIRIATGEHCHNRVMFKQLLQAGAIDVCQIDSCRVAGVNENLAILLMAAKFGIPVCPHAGGVGLCEYVQHLSDLRFPPRLLHHGGPRHRVRRPPARALPPSGRDRSSHYQLPQHPGYSIEILAESLSRYQFPEGSAWS